MKALVLSGGGAKGAFQVGALRHLLLEEDERYDILAGISVGALNSSFLSMYRSSQNTESYIALSNIWSEVNNRRIWKRWYGGLLWMLPSLWKPSVYNSQPLIDLVDSTLNVDAVKSSGRKLRIGAVSLQTGKTRYFSEHSSDIKNAVLASSSFPGFFKPIEFLGQEWTDGGARDITPIGVAIDSGADEIDCIITSPENETSLVPFKKGSPVVPDQAIRIVDIMSEEILANDLKYAEATNCLVASGKAPRKRHVKIRVIRPIKRLTDNPLDFNPTSIKNMTEIGYHAARKATATV